MDDLQILGERSAARGFQQSLSVASSRTFGRSENDEIIDLFDEEVIDLTLDDRVVAQQTLLQRHDLPVSKVVVSGFDVRQGDFFEVSSVKLGKHEVHFMRIDLITRNHRNETFKLLGTPFTRSSFLEGLLPKKLNEVCMMMRLNKKDRDSPLLLEIDAANLVQKRELRTTNAIWPEHSIDLKPFSAIKPKEARKERVKELGPLVCRWKLKIYFRKDGSKMIPDEESLERVFQTEAHQPYRVSEDTNSAIWRGDRVLGGSWPRQRADIDLEHDNRQKETARALGQKYTVFDSYSGAGGVSRGAQSAGFKIMHGLDKSPEVWDTYIANFPEATLHRKTVDEFIRDVRTQTKVDVLHLSPPCQPFSPAHTREGANDNENIASLFGCTELIKKTRPRVITLEETFGISHDRHALYLRSLLGDLTSLGFSVRWKIVRLATWGSAQDRKRLIVIAAAPGETLPTFPRPTHSLEGIGGLKPFLTFAQAIEGIDPRDPRHDLRDVRYHNPPKARLDPNRLSMTITCGGGTAYHPDGTRDLTLREFACLQGFPPNHQFFGTRTAVKRQIGNAFPSNTVRLLYKHIEDWLLKADSVARYASAPIEIVDMESDAEASPSPSPLQSRSASQRPASPEMIEISDSDGEVPARRPAKRRRVEADVEMIDLT